MFVHLVNDAAADIIAGDEPIHSDLSLEAEIPLIDVGCFRILRDDGVDTCGREYDVFINGYRKRIPSGIALPRIVETACRVCKLNQAASRRRALYSANALEVRAV